MSSPLTLEPNIAEQQRLSVFRGLLPLLFDWMVIAAAIVLAEAYPNPFVYALSLLMIGGRMMGLWVLAHEAYHRLLVPDRFWNDRLGKWLAAWPVFLNFERYRAIHLKHHQKFGTEDDPEHELMQYAEFSFPMSKWKFALICLMDLSMINFFRYKMGALFSSSPRALIASIRENGSRFGFYLILGAAAVLGGYIDLLVLYWLIPYMSWYQLIFRLRLLGDHFFEAKPDGYSRSLRLNPFERLFILPHHANYHAEHHELPSVPHYRLPELSKDIQGVQGKRVTSQGYGSVLSELLT